MEDIQFQGNKMAKQGKLIVLDGTDGSGKSTQVEMLANALKKDGHKVKLLDFPEYSKNFFGKFIGHCLSEQYYNWTHIHPKIAAIAYAADRWESSEKIRNWLKYGYIILSNRYASANQIHQGGKIANTRKREAFIKWLNKMEYGVFKIPKPDAVFYLNVPMSIVLKLIDERSKKTIRAYLGKKTDLSEGNLAYLENSHKSALWLAQTQKSWIKIECAKNGELDTRENIHKEIYEKVKKIIK